VTRSKRRAARILAVPLVVLSGIVLQRPAFADTPPTLSAIHADFVQSAFATFYRVELAGAPAGVTPRYTWTLSPPPNDPSCKVFAQTDIDPSRAVWHHADQDSCDHNKMGPQGHLGTVSVEVRLSPYVCTASYLGTETGDGAAGKCVDTRPSASPPPTPRPSTTLSPAQIASQARVDLAKANLAASEKALAAAKKDCTKLGHTWNKTAAVLAGGAAVTAPFIIVSIPLGIASAIFWFGSDAMTELGEDPPDPDYAVAVTPTLATLPTVKSGTEVTPALADELNRYLTLVNRLQGDTVALRRSWEKAQGALAAGDADWVQRHLDESVRFGNALAADLDELPGEAQKAEKALGQSASAAGVSQAQLSAALARLPAGLPAESLAAMRSTIGPETDALMAAAPRQTADVGLTQSLNPPGLQADAAAMATDLRTFTAAAGAGSAGMTASSPLIWIVLGVLVIAALAGAGLYLRSRDRPGAKSQA
jgi:hypothetical protein